MGPTFATDSAMGFRAHDGIPCEPTLGLRILVVNEGGKVKLRDALDAVPTDGQARQVYGQPYQTPDGTTIITVANLRGRPLGMFVVRGDHEKWVPAVDATPIALVAVLTGLVAATLATVAMVRRPPWPDIRGVPPQWTRFD